MKTRIKEQTFTVTVIDDCNPEPMTIAEVRRSVRVDCAGLRVGSVKLADFRLANVARKKSIPK